MPPAARPRAAGRFRWAGAWIALAAVVLVVGGAAAWNNGLRNRFLPKNFGVVDPGLVFRSGQISASLIGSTLRAHDIRSVVALAATGADENDTRAEQAAAAEQHVDWRLFPLAGDGTGKPQTYADAVAAVAGDVRDKRPVLVHCVAGAQRTGGVVALYQLLVEHKDPAEVERGIEHFGHDPRQSPALIPFLNDHMHDIAAGLVARGVIDRVPDPLPLLPLRSAD